MLAALAIMTVLFLGLCCGIAEMSPALPHAGGAYSFARTAMGPWGGYIRGLAENMEYILTPAVIVVGVGGYLGTIFGTPPGWAPLWWLACYIVFVGFNAAGVEASLRVSLVITFTMASGHVFRSTRRAAGRSGCDASANSIGGHISTPVFQVPALRSHRPRARASRQRPRHDPVARSIRYRRCRTGTRS